MVWLGKDWRESEAVKKDARRPLSQQGSIRYGIVSGRGRVSLTWLGKTSGNDLLTNPLANTAKIGRQSAGKRAIPKAGEVGRTRKKLFEVTEVDYSR